MASSSATSTSVPGATPAKRMGAPVKYGMTDPISLELPSEEDEARSEIMMRELQEQFPAESEEGMRHRQAVLDELQGLVSDWALEVSLEHGMAEEEAKQYVMKITTLGSYRLGVVHPGSDIDTLCIGPPHISREDFFTGFAARLEEQASVTECVPIPDAYTPIIKLKMRRVLIDLLYAQLGRPLAHDEDVEQVTEDDEVLRGMDDRCVRSLNGLRVANQILKLVPDQDVFRQTLRFIKYWAAQRLIYSNVLGFFGGITWSLLVARVCQLYPYYKPSQLVNRFFRLYHQWNWSIAVTLCKTTDLSNMPGLDHLKVWNPKANHADRSHVMPVITPAFPAMNSTHNVTDSTMRILLEEFKRGFQMVKSEASMSSWKDVHKPLPFFSHFDGFLCIEMLAKTEDIFKKFSGWVESKMRVLTMNLEAEGIEGITLHPNPLQYQVHDDSGEYPFASAMFIGYLFNKEYLRLGQEFDLRGPVSNFVHVLYGWSDKDTYFGSFFLRVKRSTKDRLPLSVLSGASQKRVRLELQSTDAADDSQSSETQPSQRSQAKRRRS